MPSLFKQARLALACSFCLQISFSLYLQFIEYILLFLILRILDLLFVDIKNHTLHIYDNLSTIIGCTSTINLIREYQIEKLAV